MRAYTQSILALLPQADLSPLGPGTPHLDRRDQLTALDINSVLAPETVSNRDMAGCCVAALWLRHDFLDEAHTLAQDIDTAEGSYWHAIMHRREPDPANAAYWFRRVGAHPIFAALANAAGEVGLQLQAKSWSPYDFIDLCEKHRATNSAMEMTLCEVQEREWRLLFDWCFQRA